MTTVEELSFEQAYAQLGDVVQKLESGELSLEESVKLYTLGRALSERCQALLDDAELQVNRIDDSGNITPHR